MLKGDLSRSMKCCCCLYFPIENITLAAAARRTYGRRDTGQFSCDNNGQRATDFLHHRHLQRQRACSLGRAHAARAPRLSSPVASITPENASCTVSSSGDRWSMSCSALFVVVASSISFFYRHASIAQHARLYCLLSESIFFSGSRRPIP